MQGACGVAELVGLAAESQHLRVGTEDEEDSSEDGALNDGARDGTQGIARFAAEGGSAFKSDEAEHGENERGSEIEERDAREPELIDVEMNAVADHHDGENDE